MLRSVVRFRLGSGVSRASTGVAFAIGAGSVACGGKADRLEPRVTVDADAGGSEAPGPDTTAGAVAETGCGCSTSSSLQALSCASGDGVTRAGASGLELAPSGDIALFTLCYSRPVEHCRPFRWTRAGGSEALVAGGYQVGLADDGSALVVAVPEEGPSRTLLIGRDGAAATVPLGSDVRLSADGRYVVSFAPQLASGGLPPQATFNRSPLSRWSLADGLETLGELPDGLIEGTVFDVAADASVIVGAAHDVSDGTFKPVTLLYTVEQGLRRIEAPSSIGEGSLNLVSRDGSAFSGFTDSSLSSDLAEAFYWTAAGGFRGVAAASRLLDGGFYRALSDDGLVLAGTGWLPDAARPRVYRWTAEGLIWLGPEDVASRIADMTADGNLVLGTLGDGEEGFIASPGETRRLNDLLERASLDMTGWELKAPLRISDDGKVVFGTALCGGVSTVYRWVLPE